MRTRPLWLCLSLFLTISLARAGDVQTILEDWTDTDRDRVVPVKFYHPTDLSADAPQPLLIFSHGLGGSREGYSTAATHWAEHGYVVLMLQHPGSDAAVWRGQRDGIGKLLAAANGEQWLARVKDARFAIDRLYEISTSKTHPLAGKINVSKIAMAGHSFGSHTTLALAGQTGRMGKQEITFADPRITCAIAMSPSPPPRDDDRAFEKIKIPILHMTGTHDTSPVQMDLKAVDRTVPYRQITATDQYLLVLKDGDHMMFSGRGPMGRKYGETILKSATAFLDAYLRDDAKQKDWLRESFIKELGANGTFEHK
jgi:predicted dienelactone hydrolase